MPSIAMPYGCTVLDKGQEIVADALFVGRSIDYAGAAAPPVAEHAGSPALQR